MASSATSTQVITKRNPTRKRKERDSPDKDKVDKQARKVKKDSPNKSKEKSQSPKNKKRKEKETKSEGENGLSVDDEEPPVHWFGSPWDATERKHLKIQDLDLDKSYVDSEEHKALVAQSEEGNKIELPERRPRWKHNGPTPLTDISKLKEMQWDAREPDLDPDDMEGQILRCKERIQDNIVPSFFQERLKRLEAQKASKLELVASEKQGLSWPVLLRIRELQTLEAALTKDGKPNDHLINVRSILAAYRTQTLEWTGLVTYWCRGTRLSEPRPFDWDEFEAINNAYGKSPSFWVEGMDPPCSDFAGLSLTVPINGATGMHTYNIALRFPGRDWWTELEFIYDTGSSHMLLNRNDLYEIAGPNANRGVGVDVIRTGNVRTTDENFTAVMIELEATVLDRQGRRLMPWTRQQVNVDISTPPNLMPPDRPRLDGGAFRRLLFYATSPRADVPLTIATGRASLLPNLSHGAGDMGTRHRFFETLRPNRTRSLAGIPIPANTEANDEAMEARRRPLP